MSERSRSFFHGVATFSLLALSGVACAADMLPAYLGLNVGSGRLATEAQVRTEIFNGTVYNHGSGFAASMVAGYRLNPHLGLEVQAGEIGSLEKRGAGYVDKVRIRAVSAAVTGSLPLVDAVSLVGKLGGAYARGELEVTGLSVVTSQGADGSAVLSRFDINTAKTHINNFAPLAGVALDWAIGPTLGAQLGYDFFRRVSYSETGDADVGRWSLGVYYRFGR